jgi:pyruvate/2-oxoacid:ferredoxin oxidoreductase alpha subunit
MIVPGVPAWAVTGDASHRRNVVTSIMLQETELEAHNLRLIEKYARMSDAEQRVDLFHCGDADIVIVACNTPARIAKGAVSALRARGIKAGLFRPITIWPFPIRALAPLLARAARLVVVEASDGQLEDELRLAVSHAYAAAPPIEHVRRYGGMLPSQDEIVAHVSTACIRGAA